MKKLNIVARSHAVRLADLYTVYGGPENVAHFVRLITSSNIDHFSYLFTV